MTPEHATRPKILLAEDNATNVFLVKEVLKKNQVERNVRAIGDGKAVLNFLDRIDASAQVEPLDLVLPDLHLPMRNGAEIPQHFRSSERSRLTPLHYFRKPLSLRAFMELGGIVRNILVNHQPTDHISSGDQTFSGTA